MDHPSETNNNAAPKRRRNPWLRALKWTLSTAVALMALFLLAIGVAVWILTPERLTPLVEKYATEYVDGKVSVKRVELTYWKTFPRLYLDVDSLCVVSHTLRGLTADETARLPQGADTLMTVDRFHGGINILQLLRRRIALTDVVIDHPTAMIVDVRPGLSNYNIFPVSEEKDTTEVDVPDIALRRFEITGNMPVRYVSLSDSIDFRLLLTRSSLAQESSPAYDFAMAGDARTTIGDMSIGNLRLGLGGDIIWNHKEPYKIELSSFEAGVNNINTRTSTVLDFRRDLTVERLDFEMPRVAVNEFIALVPAPLRDDIAGIANNLEVALKARLTKPYVPSVRPLPSMVLEMTVPEGNVSYQQLSLQALALELTADIDGENPDASTVQLKRLYASGEGVSFTLEGVADNLLSDPHARGTFRGGVRFSRLPSDLTQFIGCTVSGRLAADASFDLRQSWLRREDFHRIKASGTASLRDFSFAMPQEEISFYTRDTRLEFGSGNAFVKGDVCVDSLLTASLKSDTLAFCMTGLSGSGAGIRLGGGIRNNGQSADTTLITPLGVAVAIDRFSLLSTEDSLRLRLRDVKARASIKRFRDMKRVPQLSLAVDARRIAYADGLNRASLRNPRVDLTLHPSKPRLGKAMQHAVDSIRARYPHLAPDSVMAMARRATAAERRRAAARRDSLAAASANSGSQTVDFDLDNETRSLLRRWQASGSIKAERARLLTPYFPLRNVLTGVDVRFNNDSLQITNTRLKSGNSDFTVSGTISNLTRALTSRSGRQPLRLNMRVTSDTIDVNQLAAAAFAGAAFAEKEREGRVGAIADSDDDDAVQRSIAAQTADADAGPLLIPTNIEATLRVNAHNVLYSDFLFNTLRGSVEVFDGALNLRNLSARTDAGGVDLTALYQGLDKDHLSFAFGMQVRDFRIGRFMQLVPSLDTIMPLLHDIRGVINGEVAATSDLDTLMNLKIPTLSAAVSLEGDSLVLLDAETFRKIGKWLLFKNKERNVIDHMNVKMVVKDSRLELFPFIFDMDRYRLGVFGNNDMDLNFKYHVAVLKSPIPFRFGINVSGNPDKMKIRLGGAKVNEDNIGRSVAISDTTRINLVNQIESIFRRGVNTARRAGGNVRLEAPRPSSAMPSLDDAPSDTISAADSLVFIQQGLLPPKAAQPDPSAAPAPEKKK